LKQQSLLITQIVQGRISFYKLLGTFYVYIFRVNDYKLFQLIQLLMTMEENVCILYYHQPINKKDKVCNFLSLKYEY
jgi:hypothetical protein